MFFMLSLWTPVCVIAHFHSDVGASQVLSSPVLPLASLLDSTRLTPQGERSMVPWGTSVMCSSVPQEAHSGGWFLSLVSSFYPTIPPLFIYLFIYWGFTALLTHIQCAHKLCIYCLHCVAWHWDWWFWWPAGCSFHNDFAGLGGDVSILSTVRFLTHQQHLKFLDLVDQAFPEATEKHVLPFVAPVTSVGHQDLALPSSTHPIVSASAFLPVNA